MTVKRYLLAHTALCTSLLAVGAAGSAQAADAIRVFVPPTLPAVSMINGKLDAGFGGVSPGSAFSGWRVQGAVSIPLDRAYGLQIDGAVASIQGQIYSHVAAHAFWRNPAQGLLGFYADYSTWNGFNRQRFAFEGEAYLGRLSLETTTGAAVGDGPSTGLFTITDAAFYPTDNFRLSLGVRYNGSTSALAGGFEYQFASGATHAWSGFVDAEAGSNGYQKLFGGLRLYFGADKSLIRRHREDDPRVKSDEESLTNCGSGAVITDGMTVVDSTMPVDACGLDGPPV